MNVRRVYTCALTDPPDSLFDTNFELIMNLMKKYIGLALVVASFVLMGCSRHETNSAPPPQTITLNATLLSPTDVKLTWNDPVTNAAGHIVEFATEPQGEFTTLGFFPLGENTFTHPNLMPETTWYYRVRAYYGPASSEVEVALPDTLSDRDYVARFAHPEDYRWAAPRTMPGGAKAARLSVHKGETAAAPTDLKASLVPATVSGFQLTWSDHAFDEDGYLLEMKPHMAPDFSVRAVLERDINAFGYAFEPPVRRATLRVRAFYYGGPSNLVHVKTGAAAQTH